MSTIAISTADLNKIYNQGKKNQVHALNDLNLSINQGEIYGLLGENGAGKTTTVSILTTMIKMSSGSAKIMGNDVVSESKEVRKLIGCLPQDTGLYEEFTAVENMDFIANLRKLDEETKEQQITELIRIVGLEERQKDRVETYSGGMKRRLMIARSLIGNPSILFLDEPTAGIDVLVSRRIRQIVKKLARDRNITILLSTHDMLSAERLCDRVGILHKGKLVAEGPPEEIVRKYSPENRDLEDAVVNLIGWTGDQEED
ncbi:MAG: ABC transporter ATP-binding protein [Candidatus Hodarchaeales archaeon]|jgi:ABC-2 type transport system ATP-binding protein